MQMKLSLSFRKKYEKGLLKIGYLIQSKMLKFRILFDIPLIFVQKKQYKYPKGNSLIIYFFPYIVNVRWQNKKMNTWKLQEEMSAKLEDDVIG